MIKFTSPTHTLPALLLVILVWGGVPVSAHAQTAFPPDVFRLYALDGGTLSIPDANALSDTDGLPKDLFTELPVPAYLLVYGDTLVLWDAGLPLGHAALPSSNAPSLKDQITALGYSPADVDYVILSHLHFDHAGQIDQFPAAQLVVGGADYDGLSDGTLAHFDSSLLGNFGPDRPAADRGRVRKLHGDVDFFRDGNVRLLALPGHTPGHYSLLLNLPNAGPVLLSGDLYHTRFSRAHGLISDFDAVRAQSRASQERTERILALGGVRLIIAHDPQDAARFPAAPGYLD